MQMQAAAIRSGGGDNATSSTTIAAVATTTFPRNTANAAAGPVEPATNRATQQQIRLHDRRGGRRERDADVTHHPKQRKAEHDVQRDRH